ncbi:MAG: hypothetical protein DPW16_10250 [Chloroflexi bacterium]|nr:hypothetical protein [Chloroflexota bacterium]
MWPFKRKKESDGPIPYSTTPSTPPTASSFAPKPSDESRNWAVVVLDKRAGSGSGANLDDVLMADLQMEREEIGRFYKSQAPFVAVQRVTQKFAENAVRRLALAGVQAKAETMSEPATIPDAAVAPTPTAGDFSVVLVDTGRKKIEVIKVIREATRLGLKEAKDMTESIPATIIAGISEHQAQQIAREFQRVEAVVQIVQGAAPLDLSPQAMAHPDIPNLLKGQWNVVLLDSGSKKINVIKTIRAATNLGLAEAKDLAESTPATLLTGLSEAYAQQWVMQLQKDGATAQMVQGSASAVPSAPSSSTGGWNVVLMDGGNNKITVIKVIREHLELGLKEAKDLVDQTPSLLVNQVAEVKAHEFARDLQAAGATVQVSPS